MRVHLVNPSTLSFGTSVITPRWLFVLAAATPERWGTPRIVDETLDPFEPASVQPGDVVGIGIHTGNAYRGYEVGRLARERGAWVVYGGSHAGLYPDEPLEHGAAHVVVKGDGEQAWPVVLDACANGTPERLYDGGRIPGLSFRAARWDLLPDGRYMWGSVQTVRGCPKHCSFCSVWRTDGQQPRQRGVQDVVDEVVALRRAGFRFVLLADDNFYPVSHADIRMAERRLDPSRLEELREIRAQRFALMDALAELPRDMVFFTQITMEAAEDPEFLDAMRRANIKGALVGVESVTPEGLKAVYKDFNSAGTDLVGRLQVFRDHGVHVLGSFIFGLPSDRPETFEATTRLAQEAGVTFAQFVMLTPFPGTIDFQRWEKDFTGEAIDGVPLTRYWLLPPSKRPKLYTAHPAMSTPEIREGTQRAWDRFYSLPLIWQRSACVRSVKSRLAFVLISKLYRQMYANTGLATDSARANRSARWAGLIAASARRLFLAAPMPELTAPVVRDGVGSGGVGSGLGAA